MNENDFEQLLTELLNAAYDCGNWGNDDDDKRNWDEIINAYREKKEAVLRAWREKQ